MKLHTLQIWKLLVGKPIAASFLVPSLNSLSMVCAIVLASYRRGNSTKTYLSETKKRPCSERSQRRLRYCWTCLTNTGTFRPMPLG